MLIFISFLFGGNILNLNKSRMCLVGIILLFLIIVITTMIDYKRVMNLKKPIFVVHSITVDDGGSGKYLGLFIQLNYMETMI